MARGWNGTRLKMWTIESVNGWNCCGWNCSGWNAIGQNVLTPFWLQHSARNHVDMVWLMFICFLGFQSLELIPWWHYLATLCPVAGHDSIFWNISGISFIKQSKPSSFLSLPIFWQNDLKRNFNQSHSTFHGVMSLSKSVNQ